MTIAAGASLMFASAPSQAAPQIGAAALDGTAGASDTVQDVQLRVHVYRGHRCCFYFDGWHGAGWYRCGWAWRRGYGWGGVYGWNDWFYGPAVTRFGRDRHTYSHGHYGRSGGTHNWQGRTGVSGPAYSGSSRMGTRSTTGQQLNAPGMGGRNLGGRSGTSAAPTMSAPGTGGAAGGASGGAGAAGGAGIGR